MPPRKKTAKDEALEGESTEIGTGDLLGAGEETEDDAIAELRGLGVDGEYKYTVSKVAGAPGEKGGYCAVYGVGDLSLDTIREQFGGGKYRIRVTDANGKYVTNRTIEIVALPKPAATPAAVTAPAGPDLQGLAAILSAVKPTDAGKGGVETMIPLLIAMMQNQMESLKAIMSANKGPSMAELLALIQANKPAESEGGAVAMLLKGLELGKELGGGGDTGMLDVAKEGLGVLSTIVSQESTKAAAPVAVRRPAPRLAPPAPPATTLDPAAPAAPAPQPAPAPKGTPMIQQLNWLKQQLAALCLQAARQRDPELYAEVLLDNLPPFITEEELLSRVQADNAVDQLAMLDRRVAQYRPWFEEFRQALIAMLTDTGEEGEEGEDGEEGEAPDMGDDPTIPADDGMGEM